MRALLPHEASAVEHATIVLDEIADGMPPSQTKGDLTVTIEVLRELLRDES